ncbi:Uncharacterised protein [BD1-7 clade bacterium]|uniref:Uncharacterized protein n=1 Tax=BD1-7 clade bacterium TaxID=2029982 RepID=A0A5S9PHH7_9GAMM|nr:Uncharacterised protein [BD1-7 clade bacterium]
MDYWVVRYSYLKYTADTLWFPAHHNHMRLSRQYISAPQLRSIMITVLMVVDQLIVALSSVATIQAHSYTCAKPFLLQVLHSSCFV